MNKENLLGLPLSLARELANQELVVVASGPPFLARGYTPHWGEERIVRVRELGECQIEVVVTRELIGEERAAHNDRRAGNERKKTG